jgi:hypothetical protein
MSTPSLTPADALRESLLTADYQRNADAREVAAWTWTHHPDLVIAQRARQSQDRYVSLSRAYIGVKSSEAPAPELGVSDPVVETGALPPAHAPVSTTLPTSDTMLLGLGW